MPALFRVKTMTDALSLLPFIAFLLLWCGIESRIALETLCAIELFAGKGIFRWSYRILHWGKDIQAREEDVTAVIAKTRWYGNRLNVSMAGRTYSLGDLMDEDMTIVARELRRRSRGRSTRGPMASLPDKWAPRSHSTVPRRTLVRLPR